MASLELKNVTKRWDQVTVIPGLDLTINSGEFVVFVGPSGCGKSTLLRMIAGLEEITEGQLLISGADMTRQSASERGIAMVFQSYALYPNMSVRDNLAYPLEMAKRPKAEINRKVDEVAAKLHLTEYLGRLPRALSGGQRQRVAIGRAIIREPSIFLFDEPLSNLDAELRLKMRIEIARLHEALGNTMIYVTHDQLEAMTLADRIVVLRQGKIEQTGAPLEIYHNPDNLFVAGFIGSPKINVLPATVTATKPGEVQLRVADLALENLVCPVAEAVEEGETLWLGVRPEHIICKGEGTAQFTAPVSWVEKLGHTNYVYLDIGREEMLVVELRDGDNVETRQEMSLALSQPSLLLFRENGLRLR
ncbi:ABC transporter ATP-binding protein [Mangrovibacter plantisponsor]|uniref:Multiple sugar transport system ATP-binding protein n=1 Tax=Mangrovibacter plantisponsor TaxID=451513 RepID=A0A317Q719_9ENTR|nr:ABC transporter ATP-binding protein [Mangrovibacter plantisponsor]PWW11733.1 multiple sugar transport system ATP-binding protein [Mangrovibacter plantisponsor]